MKSTTSSQKSRIRILQNGPSKEDYAVAADLIREGFAKGDVIENHTGQGDPVHALHWGGLSEKGREYLDTLKRQQHASLLGILSLMTTFIVGIAGVFHAEILKFFGF